MKAQIILPVLLLILGGCAKEITNEATTDQKAVYTQANPTELNKLASAVTRSNNHTFRFQTILGEDNTATIPLIEVIDVTPLQDWPSLQVQIKKRFTELELLNSHKEYNSAILMASYRFLTSHLLKLKENTPQKASTLKYHLNVLIKYHSIEWDILADIVSKLHQSGYYQTKEAEGYILSGAQKDLNKYPELVRSTEKTIETKNDPTFGVQAELNHFENIIADAQYAINLLSRRN